MMARRFTGRGGGIRGGPASPAAILVLALVALVTFLHYNTSVHIHEAHGIYRRLYYFPIVIAAFLYGWRGGLTTAVLVCVVYIPHAFGRIGFDPAPTLEKVLEMVLYVAIGLLAGLLVDRRERSRRGLERALAEKAAMEAELVRSARLAAVGRLSAGLAHEIRNPLASIGGAAEILADDFPPGHRKSRLLSVLQEEVSRLNGVLSRFLDFARPRRIEFARLDLAAEIGHVVELAGRAAEADIGFLPPAGCAFPVAGDRDQVRQALLNVVLNAMAAAGPGGRVAIAVAATATTVDCVVDDDGPGFTSDALASFGTPFFTTREGGSGLGLAISVRIMEDHGGSIVAENRAEGGARVLISFPRAEEIV